MKKSVFNICSFILYTVEDELKNKWKNLRDYYRTKILEQKKSGSAAETQTLSWPYYRLMSFMKDQMTPKRSRSNLRRKSEDVDGEISRKQPRSNSTSTITTSATGSRLQHSNVVLLPSTANNSPSFEGKEDLMFQYRMFAFCL